MQIKIEYPMRRILAKPEAAEYCHIPIRKFPVICPVKPVVLSEDVEPGYDVRDLDKWIDLMKAGGKEEGSDDDITDKL